MEARRQPEVTAQDYLGVLALEAVYDSAASGGGVRTAPSPASPE